MRAQRHVSAVVLAVGALVGVVALTSCTSGSKSNQGATTDGNTASRSAFVNPTLPAAREPTPVAGKCSLVAGAAVTKAFGGTVSTYSETVTGTGSPQCSFTIKGAPVGDPLTVVVNEHTSESAADFASAKKLALGSGATSVSGIGDNAYYLQSQATIRFIRHKSTVSVQATLKAGTGSATIADRMSADLQTLAKAIAATR